jgi:hypothetical protein
VIALKRLHLATVGRAYVEQIAIKGKCQASAGALALRSVNFILTLVVRDQIVKTDIAVKPIRRRVLRRLTYAVPGNEDKAPRVNINTALLCSIIKEVDYRLIVFVVLGQIIVVVVTEPAREPTARDKNRAIFAALNLGPVIRPFRFDFSHRFASSADILTTKVSDGLNRCRRRPHFNLVCLNSEAW